jgi:CDP-glucose 4,6-dehydratase
MGSGAGCVENLVTTPDPTFWAGKRVLLTGHTGFKGAWAARMLALLGARVTGFALDPAAGPQGFAIMDAGSVLARDLRCDLRDFVCVKDAVQDIDIVLHFAAQAIVSQGLRDPIGTWASNVMGTAHLLDALRGAPVAAAVIVTSDKVYRNTGVQAFDEGCVLGGDDPYSASKVAVEHLLISARQSFADLPPIAAARAGNVIGGGDFGPDRLIPDLIRAGQKGQPLILRNPDATRPFQHVLDVVTGYLLLAQHLVQVPNPVLAVNFGPAEQAIRVRDLLAIWQDRSAIALDWQQSTAAPMPEKPALALNSDLARARLGWSARYDIATAVDTSARWYQAWADGAAIPAFTDAQIIDFWGI